MKKYFMKGTDDEVQTGDMIEVILTGEENGKVKHTHVECKFSPEFVEELIDCDIIEEREFEDEEVQKDLEDFEDYDEIIDNLVVANEEMNKRVAALETAMKALKKEITKSSKK